MKYLSLLLISMLLACSSAFANPEIGRQIHFVLDKDNANHEFKPSAGSDCTGGTIPNGDGTAWGEVTCSGKFDLLPWYNTPVIGSQLQVVINSDETANIECELFDFSNNAGNNQGFNVTQYNAPAWKSTYNATELVGESGYFVVMHTICLQGLQQ